MEAEILEVLHRHIGAVINNDWEAYIETTADDLSLYEWYFVPDRIDGLPFHQFVMGEGASFGSRQSDDRPRHYELLNLRIQRYDDTAIASYTLLRTTAGAAGLQFERHNESRVLVRRDGNWKVVHVHKSPAWQAPYSPPS